MKLDVKYYETYNYLMSVGRALFVAIGVTSPAIIALILMIICTIKGW